MPPGSTIYAFGECELDEARHELRLRGRAQLVPPRVFTAMLHLIRNRARAVSRDELVEVVWGGLAVSDAALSQTIMLARKLTQDEGDQQRVIKTVRGHGFRFVAEVSELQQSQAPESRAASPAPSTAHARRSGLLGRARELGELSALLARAERGHGSLVFLHGEPGIGKTSLAEQFCVHAGGRGAQVFWGRCWEEGGAPAFWPFIQVLRAIHARLGTEQMRSWFDPRCVELLALVPELAEAPSQPAPTSPSTGEGTQARFRVFDGMTRVLKRMAHASRLDARAENGAAGPALVIALEDLHAADDASIQLLRFLSAELGDVPLLVLGTFRDLEVTRDSALGALLGGPLENTARVALSRLERLDVGRLAEGLAGHAVTGATLDLLHELSGGNPFLVTELARLSQQELELSALSVLRMPERMARAVGRRLQGLPDATRALLEVAAVLGREFSLAALASVQGCPQQGLLGDLDPALREELIEPVPASAGARVRFSHALVRDALYGALGLARRVSLHRQVGEALESCQRAHQLPLYELAHHFYLAAPQGCVPKAIDYALRAATHAEQLLAFDSAASLRDRVFELSSTLPEPDAGALYDLLIAAGHAWYRAGELDKATARYSRAAEQARVRGDAAGLALAASLYVKARRGFVLFDAHFFSLVRAALAALPPGDGVLRAKLLGFRSLSAHALGPAAERDAGTREALEMARRIEDHEAIGYTLALRRWLMAGALHPSETRLIATELVDRKRQANRNEGVLEGLFWRLQDQLELGETELAARDFAEYGALAEGERNMTHRYWALLFGVMQRSWRGELDQAAELADRALAFGQRIREPMAAMMHAAQLWNIRALQGTSDQLPDSITGLLSFMRGPSLLVRFTQGRHDEARRLFEELARNDFADIARDPFRRMVLSAASTGCALLDDRARAKALYELLLPDADLNVIGLSSWVFLGPVSQFLGRLAACMCDYELAAQHFERALAQCARFGARPQLAILQHEYAQLLSRLPGVQAGRAAKLLAEAERAAEELGIPLAGPLTQGVSA